MSRVAGSADASDRARLADITVLILTLNEARNIARCLDRLTWARRVVVLDSFSSDDTVEIARRYANVDVHTREFDDHAAQWNHGLSLAATPWVLSLDADYLVPESFPAEALKATSQSDLSAAFARVRYCVYGRPLRASLYPPRAVLFRREACRYQADGHTQRLVVPGRTITLDTPFDHDDRKSLNRWLESQGKYSRLEATKLLSNQNLTFQDRLRRTMVLAPPAIFIYTLIGKGALLDGWPGWYYTLQRTLAEMLLSLHLLDRRLREGD
jgi:glycosyltransferase involved in cell wall biosynthesis